MTTLHATHDVARQYIVGSYDNIGARLEAAGVDVDWTDAYPLIDADDDIVGVVTPDDDEPFVLVNRIGEYWIAHNHADEAAMRPWVAASLGIGQKLPRILAVYVNGREISRARGKASEINDDEAVRLADMISDSLNHLDLRTKNGEVIEFVSINVPNVPPFAVMAFSMLCGPGGEPVALRGTYSEPQEDIMDVLRNTENTQLRVFGEWQAWRNSRYQQ